MTSKIKTVLIVGGCGLIGKQLVKDMLDGSYQIVIGDIQNERNNLWLKKLPKDKVLFSMLDANSCHRIFGLSLVSTHVFCWLAFGQGPF